MPTPALLLLIATLLPLASFTVLVFWGKRMGTFASYVATAAISGSFVCSLLCLQSWLNGGQYLEPATQKIVEWGGGKGPINIPYKWIPVGPGIDNQAGYLDVGIYVDSLTVAMFNMITLIASLVHVFSIGYMAGDKRFPRFFTYLGLFCFSMLGLVLGGTVLQLFIFWELVGLCSYLLIGFWYEKKSASNAAMKAFITNRVGDFGFLIGFGILFYHLGNVTLPNMWVALGTAGQGGNIELANGITFTSTLLTVMGIGLFFGAVGKSAQFPLHVWLPDAMEGPTPVSALIHAATMVAAGVYLVGRIFPILTPDAKLFIAIIGCVTLAMAALIAIAQSDIKKVLAYSTLSQLGYMILAMGLGSWVGGLFHLITHAFFKALLFLGSGSVIHAAHHEQELPQYGGLWKKIPVTAFTFLIAVFAIAGTPALSAYYSKDLILAHAASFGYLSQEMQRSNLYWALFIVPTVIAYVTAFYMMRCWTLTFWGKPRNQKLYDHAHETPILYLPLIVLAVLSIIGGKWLGVKEMLMDSIKESEAICLRADAKFAGFATAWSAVNPHEHHDAETTDKSEHGAEPVSPADHAAEGHASAEAAHAGGHAESVSAAAHGKGWDLMHHWLGWAWAIGIGIGFLLYMNGYAIANVLMKIAPLRWIHTWLYRRMYFDELYFSIFVAFTMGLSKFCAVFDKYVVDGLVNFVAYATRQVSVAAGATDKYVVDGAVNGVATVTQEIGAAVRAPQTGRIRMYVTVLILAVTLCLAGAIIVVLSK